MDLSLASLAVELKKLFQLVSNMPAIQTRSQDPNKKAGLVSSAVPLAPVLGWEGRDDKTGRFPEAH